MGGWTKIPPIRFTGAIVGSEFVPEQRGRAEFPRSTGGSVCPCDVSLNRIGLARVAQRERGHAGAE